jgi:hypothetical protein
MRDEDLIDALERESNPTGSDGDSGEGCLVILILIGLIFCSFIFGSCFGEKEFKTEKKIEPTIKLTTDGKTIDTVYIYRENDK